MGGCAFCRVAGKAPSARGRGCVPACPSRALACLWLPASRDRPAGPWWFAVPRRLARSPERTRAPSCESCGLCRLSWLPSPLRPRSLRSDAGQGPGAGESGASLASCPAPKPTWPLRKKRGWAAPKRPERPAGSGEGIQVRAPGALARWGGAGPERSGGAVPKAGLPTTRAGLAGSAAHRRAAARGLKRRRRASGDHQDGHRTSSAPADRYRQGRDPPRGARRRDGVEP